MGQTPGLFAFVRYHTERPYESISAVMGRMNVLFTTLCGCLRGYLMEPVIGAACSAIAFRLQCPKASHSCDAPGTIGVVFQSVVLSYVLITCSRILISLAIYMDFEVGHLRVLALSNFMRVWDSCLKMQLVSLACSIVSCAFMLRALPHACLHKDPIHAM